MDSNDGAPWTESDLEDLQARLERGGSIEEAAELLCRQGTVGEVAAKAAELGLQPGKPVPKSGG